MLYKLKTALPSLQFEYKTSLSTEVRKYSSARVSWEILQSGAQNDLVFDLLIRYLLQLQY
jgi:hypothetical protein